MESLNSKMECLLSWLKPVSLVGTSISVTIIFLSLYCLGTSEFSEVFHGTLRIFDYSGFDTGRCQAILDRVLELYFLYIYLSPRGWSVNIFYGAYIFNLLSLLVLC